MEKIKSISSSGIFTLFFSLQSIGYLHGLGIFGKVNIENTISFGIYHLSNIFQFKEVIALPVSPLLCGFLLMLLPSIEESELTSKAEKSKLVYLFLSIFIPLSFTIVLGSVFGPEKSAEMVNNLQNHLGLGVLRPIIYLSLYVIAVLGCWKFRKTTFTKLRKLLKIFDKSLLILFSTVWLLYGCYIGSRFDGASDKLNHSDVLKEFISETKK